MLVSTRRGQVFPLWLGASALLLTLVFFGLNYADTVRWQIRAQNAADAAAQAMLAPQNQRWNTITSYLYVLALEEHRLRSLVDAMHVVETRSGGCQNVRSTTDRYDQCADAWVTLMNAFKKSQANYSGGVLALHAVTYHGSFDDVRSDALTILGHLTQHCGLRDGGDCAFAYTVFNDGYAQRQDTNMRDVYADAQYIYRQSGSPGENAQLFAPAKVEVVVCRKIPPLIGSFFSFKLQPHYVIARGAATSVIVNSEWLEPGYYVNPATSKPFQQLEQYVQPTSLDGLAGAYDWYGVQFSSQNWSADPSKSSFTPVSGSAVGAFDRFVSWWSSIPIKPFSGRALAPGTPGMNCS